MSHVSHDDPAERLRRAVESEAGVRCAVEARGRLAILRAADADGALGGAQARARIVALAREHGFTHAALELDD